MKNYLIRKRTICLEEPRSSERGLQKSHKPNTKAWKWYKYLPRGTGLASLQAVWYFVMFSSSSSGRSSGRSSGSGKQMLLIGATLS